MSHLAQMFAKAAPFIPFIATAGTIKMGTPRIIEAIIIALITAGITVYTLTIRLEERDNARAAQIHKVEVAVSDLTKIVTENRVSMGDRWTGDDQKVFERQHQRVHHDHNIRGHWNAPDNPD